MHRLAREEGRSAVRVISVAGYANTTQGEPVSIDTPISHDFRRKVTPGNPKRVFPTKIVVSYQDKESLPYQLEEGEVCEVRRRWLN